MKNVPHIGVLLALIIFTACNQSISEVEQAGLAKVNEMPDSPTPYNMPDWQKKTEKFDNVIFNHQPDSTGISFIWLDSARRNFSQTTFGLYTVIGDVRQGPDVNKGEFHEAINSLGALLSAGLLGIDKTSQHGYNYVEMVQNYFNYDSGWNIMMNNTCEEVALLGGGYGRDWWYDVFPNVLYYAVCDLFPGVNRADSLQRIIAEQFFKSDSVLDGNYDYSYFDYNTMRGESSHIPFQ
ncbi:MAG: hypothetical protein K8R35_02350, partial [Bacteroidales bacterium]|nr:hypothetical protein [Bacteroidales bacterium]